MTVYVVVHIVPKDQKLLAEYREVGKPAIEKHGGRALAGGPDARMIEDGGAGGATVVLAFPNDAAVMAWMEDPALAEVHALRRSAAASTIWIAPELGG